MPGIAHLYYLSNVYFMIRENLAVGEYYHIFNRAINKQVIFHDSSDWDRFLFLIVYFQLPEDYKNISRIYRKFVINVQSQALHIDKSIQKRQVEVVSFCIMPNHFHLILKEIEEGGITKYMHRILTSYAKYYNAKYEKTGHLFQGPFKSVHVSNNNQLLYLSAYIHKNPNELFKSKSNIQNYLYSSFRDYVGENRWGDLLAHQIVSEQFKQKPDYLDYVLTSTAKELEEGLIID